MLNYTLTKYLNIKHAHMYNAHFVRMHANHKSQTLHLIICLPISGGGGLEWGKGTEGNE